MNNAIRIQLAFDPGSVAGFSQNCLQWPFVFLYFYPLFFHFLLLKHLTWHLGILRIKLNYNFTAFSQFLAVCSTLYFTRSPLAGKGTWCLITTTPSTCMLPTAKSNILTQLHSAYATANSHLLHMHSSRMS